MTHLMKCMGSYQVQGEGLKAHIIDTTSGELYDNDSESELRLKFVSLILVGHLILFPFHLVYRIFDLISGGFIHRGRAEAEKKLFGTTPKKATLVFAIFKDLLVHIAKIALLPLAIIPKIFVAFFGLAFPNSGRKWYAKIDQFFYVVPKNKLAKWADFGKFCQFNAPCMQTQTFRIQHNLYRYCDDYVEKKG